MWEADRCAIMVLPEDSALVSVDEFFEGEGVDVAGLFGEVGFDGLVPEPAAEDGRVHVEPLRQEAEPHQPAVLRAALQLAPVIELRRWQNWLGWLSPDTQKGSPTISLTLRSSALSFRPMRAPAANHTDSVATARVGPAA